MGDHPLGIRSPATLAFLCPQSPKAAIFSNREFRLADRLGEFLRGVPVLHLLSLDQHCQHRLDAPESLIIIC